MLSFQRDSVVSPSRHPTQCPGTFSNLPCTCGKILQALTTHYCQSHSTPVNSTSPQLAELSPTEPYVALQIKKWQREGHESHCIARPLLHFLPCCYLLYRECTLFIKLSRLTILIPFISSN